MFCLGITISGVLVEVREVLEIVPLLLLRKVFLSCCQSLRVKCYNVLKMLFSVYDTGLVAHNEHFTHSDVQWGSSYLTDVLAYSDNTFKMQFRSRFAIRDEK